MHLKPPAHRAGLPGKVISFYIVPLDPAYPARAGRGTFRSNKKRALNALSNQHENFIH